MTIASFVAPASSAAGARERPLCLYVSSYHRGYMWSDGVEDGLRETLEDVCDVEQFDMDTKRRRDEASIRDAAARANTLIERLAPDIVVTSDDNAAKYLIVPYLLDGPVPVVFAGINWTVEEYGFPAANVTGIVEVAPIRPLIREALRLAPDARRAAYVGARTLTEVKNHERMAKAARTAGVVLDDLMVETFADWKNALDLAQYYDFVVVSSHAGIDGWDTERAREHAAAVTRRPSLTNMSWMMPVSVVGYTKLPAEQGERAGEIARAILEGTAIEDIPLVVNTRWDVWLNVALAEGLEVDVPDRLRRQAKHVGTSR